MSLVSRSWIVRRPRPDALIRLRLFCLPYAGGTAHVYRRWPAAFPEEIEVCAIQLPGRHDRFREPPFRRFQPLVEALTDAITPLLDVPFAIIGHSLGGTLAFELARHLQRRNRPLPEVLILAGCRPPHLPPSLPSIAHLSDSAFLRMVRDIGGLPEEVVCNTELVKLLLPMLRADFEVLESYRFVQDTALKCPLVALGGIKDSDVSEAELRGWRLHTCSQFQLIMYPGGHFFLDTCTKIFADVFQILERAVPFLPSR